MLIGEPLTSPPTAALDFVEDEEQVVFVRQIAQRFEKASWWNPNATLALDRFDQNCAGFAVDKLPHTFEVAVVRVRKAAQERPDPFVVLRLCRSARCAVRSTVESATKSNDFVAAVFRVQAGELDRRL